MSTITLPNIRISSDLTVKLKLKDGGVALDWSTLQNIKVSIYSDAQRALAGRCGVSIDAEDSTLLVCSYAANKPQYVGVNRVVVTAKYMGETKTYDKPAFNFVRWTDDQAGEQITIEDPDIDVEISVEDVSSSILQEAVDAAFGAADRANDAAAAAEHMVDIHTGPAGKSPYIGENGHWYEWDEETHQYVDTETNAKGDTGETPDISIGTVTTVEPGTPAAASMGGTPEAPVLNLSIPKGAVGATPNFTVGTVTTGQPGTPVVITITGTAEAPVLNVTIPQGLKGDTGVSADYPITIHNGLDSDATDEALAAFQGKVLDGKVSQLEAEVNEILSSPRFPIDFKNALLNCFRGVAWVGNNGSSLINSLETAMNRAELLRIDATYTQTGNVYPTTPLNDLKTDLVVVAYYSDGTDEEINDYTLSGSLSVGTSAITVTYGSKTDTIQVTVSAKNYYSLSDGDLVKIGATTTLNATNGWYLTESTYQAGRRRSFPTSAGVKSFRVTEDDVTFIDDSNYYPIPIPEGTASVTIEITPNTQFFAAVFAAYSNGSYGAVLLDTGWKSGSYTVSVPLGATHMSVVSKYNSTGTTYPTEPSELKITFNS